MSLGQLDQQLTKQLYAKMTPINFKIIGSSNGVILNDLFPFKAMMFVSALVEKEKIVYDLCVADISTVSSQQQAPSPKPPSENTPKKLHRYPLLFSGMLAKIVPEHAPNIHSIQLQLQQAPKQQLFFSLKITVTYNSISSYTNTQQTRDTVALLVVDPNYLLKQANPVVHLLRLKVGDDQVRDVGWHPLGGLVLVVLLGNQVLEVWELMGDTQEEGSIHQIENSKLTRPTLSLKLHPYKTQHNLNESIKFTSIAIPEPTLSQSTNPQIPYLSYTLFLQDSIGELTSIFPFLPPGTLISKQQYDLIYTDQQNGYQYVNQLAVLRNYINSCKLDLRYDEEVDGDLYCVGDCDGGVESYYYAMKWDKSIIKYTNKSHVSKFAKELSYFGIKMLPIVVDIPQGGTRECILCLQTVHNIYKQTNDIWLGLITKPMRIEQGHHFRAHKSSITSNSQLNKYYQVTQIVGEQTKKKKDIRFINASISSVRKVLQKFQCVFYTEGSSLYKIDLSKLYKLLEEGNINDDKVGFNIDLVFRLKENESIAAMAISISNSVQGEQNQINFIRRTKNKIKFQIQTLQNMKKINQINNISKLSIELIKKINNLKIQSSQSGNKANTKLTQPQMNINKNQSNLQEIKNSYEKYCDSVKGNIDNAMSKLKQSYQLMQKKLKKFNQFKNKKKQLNNLFAKVQQNNKIISSLLFQKQPPSTNILQSHNPQFEQIEYNIDSLKELLQTSRKKQLILTPQANEQMMRETKNLLAKLETVKYKVQTCQKIKKDMNNIQKVNY